MILVLGLVASSMLNAGPKFQLTYEVEMVEVNAQTPGATVEHILQREEFDARSRTKRVTKRSHGTTTITTSDGRTTTWETIDPSGKKETTSLKMGKKDLTWERVLPDGTKQTTTTPRPADNDAKALEQAGFGKIMGLLKGMGQPKETTELKTIAGARCRKTVVRGSLDGSDYEMDCWNAVDKAYVGWNLPPFESDYYTVEDGQLKLQDASTVISVKLGRQRPPATN